MGCGIWDFLSIVKISSSKEVLTILCVKQKISLIVTIVKYQASKHYLKLDKNFFFQFITDFEIKLHFLRNTSEFNTGYGMQICQYF